MGGVKDSLARGTALRECIKELKQKKAQLRADAAKKGAPLKLGAVTSKVPENPAVPLDTHIAGPETLTLRQIMQSEKLSYGDALAVFTQVREELSPAGSPVSVKPKHRPRKENNESAKKNKSAKKAEEDAEEEEDEENGEEPEEGEEATGATNVAAKKGAPKAKARGKAKAKAKAAPKEKSKPKANATAQEEEDEEEEQDEEPDKPSKSGQPTKGKGKAKAKQNEDDDQEDTEPKGKGKRNAAPKGKAKSKPKAKELEDDDDDHDEQAEEHEEEEAEESGDEEEEEEVPKPKAKAKARGKAKASANPKSKPSPNPKGKAKATAKKATAPKIKRKNAEESLEDMSEGEEAPSSAKRGKPNDQIDDDESFGLPPMPKRVRKKQAPLSPTPEKSAEHHDDDDDDDVREGAVSEEEGLDGEPLDEMEGVSEILERASSGSKKDSALAPHDPSLDDTLIEDGTQVDNAMVDEGSQLYLVKILIMMDQPTIRLGPLKTFKPLTHLRSCSTFKEGQALLAESRASSQAEAGPLVSKKSLDNLSDLLTTCPD